MSNGTERARRRRPGALSVAQAEAELPDDVRRRWRAGSRVAQGWVPGAPEPAPDDTRDSDTGHVDTSNEDRDGDDPADTVPASTGDTVRDVLRRRMPLGLRGADVVPSGKAVAGLAGLLAAALVLVLVLTWLQRPGESPVPSVPSARRSAPAGTVVSLPNTATPSPDVVVHVAGAVRRPGLVELPGGSRVDDAVTAAGGATRKADLGSVNLARPLVDGEQIVVLPEGKAAAPTVPGPLTTGSSQGGQPIDLNTATLDQLDGLPGVGPVLAQRIIEWRTSHGRFSSVDELTEVSGIGERTLADLRPLVRT